jgi:hypothetical protein
LEQLSASALRIYIYLCSFDRDQPVAASVPMIGKTVGVKTRATVTALQILQEYKLISCEPGDGNRPNKYRVLFPASASTPAPALPTAPQAAIPQLTKDPAPATAVRQEKPTLPELIARCYRPIDSRELAELRAYFPDQSILTEQLNSLANIGGVAPYMGLDFLARVLSSDLSSK